MVSGFKHYNGSYCDIYAYICRIHSIPNTPRFLRNCPTSHRPLCRKHRFFFTLGGSTISNDTKVHDLFFFHERARKVNIWAFTFLVAPYAGPLVSSFLLARISWRFDMGILAIFYAVSTALVVLLGEETLYDRKKSIKPTEGASKTNILIGVAGARAEGQTSMMSVWKHLLELLIRPQLLLPCWFITLQNEHSPTNVEKPSSSSFSSPGQLVLLLL